MISLDDVLRARERIAGQVKLTPCERSEQLSQATGAEVYLKLENLQVTGAFKERGALNKLLCLSAREKARGVIAASAGNHAQGVAYHAARLKVGATIVMPETTPWIKVSNTRGHGARVVLHGSNYDDCCEHARRLEREQGLTFIHPFDDAEVMAGQGTIGLELSEQVPDLEAVVVPVGGGGVIAGIATAIKGLGGGVRVFGVQAARFPSMVKSLEEGRPTLVKGSRTIADGIQVKRPGEQPFEVVRERVDGVSTVRDSEIADAIMLLLEREKLVVEGAGAVGVAALLGGQLPQLRRRRVAVVLCGGNIDVQNLNLIIDRSLVRSGRLVRLGVRLQDRPGALADFLQVVADQEASVLEIHHNRVFSSATFWEADVAATLETRDPRHAEEVKAALAEAGYALREHAPERGGWLD